MSDNQISRLPHSSVHRRRTSQCLAIEPCAHHGRHQFMTTPCTSIQSTINTFHGALFSDVERWAADTERTSSEGVSTVIRETMIRQIIQRIRLQYLNEMVPPNDNAQQSDIDGLSSSWTSHWRSTALTKSTNDLWILLGMESHPFIEQLQVAGKLYEGLLALDEPQSDTAPVHGEKSTTRRYRDGAHFTPTKLAESLVETTLKPVLETVEVTNSASAILALKVCDPAMGGGALLIHAAERLARRLACVRLSRDRGASLPLLSLASARREIVERCIYGVDKHEPTVQVARLILSSLGTLPNCPPCSLTLGWGLPTLYLSTRCSLQSSAPTQFEPIDT